MSDPPARAESCCSVDHKWCAVVGSTEVGMGFWEVRIEKEGQEERWSENFEQSTIRYTRKANDGGFFWCVWFNAVPTHPHSEVLHRCIHRHIYSIARSSAFRAQRGQSPVWKQVSCLKKLPLLKRRELYLIPSGHHFSVLYLVTFSCSGAVCFEEEALKTCCQQAVVMYTDVRRLAAFPLIMVLVIGTDRFSKEYLTWVSCAFFDICLGFNLRGSSHGIFAM